MVDIWFVFWDLLVLCFKRDVIWVFCSMGFAICVWVEFSLIWLKFSNF